VDVCWQLLHPVLSVYTAECFLFEVSVCCLLRAFSLHICSLTHDLILLEFESAPSLEEERWEFAILKEFQKLVNAGKVIGISIASPFRLLYMHEMHTCGPLLQM